MEAELYPICKFFSDTRTFWKGRKQLNMNCVQEDLSQQQPVMMWTVRSAQKMMVDSETVSRWA
jgi:hypothetical protein